MQLIKVSLYHQFSPIEVLGLINKITEALALTQHIKECKIEYTGNLTETSICMEIPDSITLFNGKQLLSDVLDGFINNFYLVTYSITVSKLITTKRVNVNTLILIMCADLVYAILLDGYMIKHYQDHLPNMEYNTYSDHYIFLDTNTNKSTYVMRL